MKPRRKKLNHWGHALEGGKRTIQPQLPSGEQGSSVNSPVKVHLCDLKSKTVESNESDLKPWTS